jgi:hypothetical protein
MTPSSHPDPATRDLSNQLLADAGYEVVMGPSLESAADFRKRLRRLRLQAYFLWPVAFASLAIVGWHFEYRAPALSWLAFAGVLWVMFVGRARSEGELLKQRCPACAEMFFHARNRKLFKQRSVWSNVCGNCGFHAG